MTPNDRCWRTTCCDGQCDRSVPSAPEGRSRGRRPGPATDSVARGPEGSRRRAVSSDWSRRDGRSWFSGPIRSHRAASGSNPTVSCTARRSFCLQPRSRSVSESRRGRGETGSEPVRRRPDDTAGHRSAGDRAAPASRYPHRRRRDGRGPRARSPSSVAPHPTRSVHRAKDAAVRQASCPIPLSTAVFTPLGYRDRRDVAALTDQVGDAPMLLALLDGLQGESQRVAATTQSRLTCRLGMQVMPCISFDPRRDERYRRRLQGPLRSQPPDVARSVALSATGRR